MSEASSILRSQGNPEGWKLEDLLARICDEISANCKLIERDGTAIAQDVLRNNRDIIVRLHECRRLQENSLERLKEKGPDQGPLGKPHIGVGS